MARRRTHKFAVQTIGLTAEEAAQLACVISYAAWAATGGESRPGAESQFACSVPVSLLREMFPDGEWEPWSAADRRALV